MRKVQSWRPDTHPGVEVHEQWDTDDPQGAKMPLRVIVDGVDVPLKRVTAHYSTLREEHTRKNLAEGHIIEMLPGEFKKPELDSDQDLTGKMVVKDKHQPIWKHFGAGEYEFEVPGLTSTHPHHAVLSKSLMDKFGGKVRLKG